MVAYRPRTPAPHQVIGEQHADLVAAQRPPPGPGPVPVRAMAPRPRTGRRPGRWRSRRPRRLAWPARAAGPSRPAPPGWESRPWETRDPAAPASATTDRPVNPAAANAAERDVRTDAVQRRVRDREVPRPRRGRPRRPHPGGTRRRSRRRAPCPARRAAPPQRTDGPDRGLDLGVDRRHDLRPGALRAAQPRTEIDLVPVVLRRIVARGDHHAGGRRRRSPSTAYASTGCRQRSRAAAARAGRRRSPPGRSRSANAAEPLRAS